jgi:hypothetical protein
MVMVLLEGGLGSQMFGYAIGRRTSLALGCKLELDIRNYYAYDKFQPELHHFDISARTMSMEESAERCGPDQSNVHVVHQRVHHFDPSMLEIEDPNCLIVGNYISEDYFFDAVDEVRRDFRRITTPDAYGQHMAAEIERVAASGATPVAVHVRRGDKANDPSVNQVHGTASVEYYDNAMALMGRLVENPWYFFFSDDPAWVETNVRFANGTVCRPDATSAPVEDMMLMAQCGHHILGNSTYSWWGAWLAEPREGHVVIGPRPFIADRTINTEDILLRDWIGLSLLSRPEPSLRVQRGKFAQAEQHVSLSGLSSVPDGLAALVAKLRTS